VAEPAGVTDVKLLRVAVSAGDNHTGVKIVASSDTLYSIDHFRLPTNMEDLVLLGNADLQGYGNALANSIVGNSGNNILDGGAGADILMGGAGNDAYFVDVGNSGNNILDDGAGADFLMGGVGNDASSITRVI
jgi:Ca2+-binding RTX toxin-like protein